MARLLIIASAPVMAAGAGQWRLDTKFVEGMRLHRELWQEPVDALLWQGVGPIPFGADYAEADLGFGLTVLGPGEPVTSALLAPYGVVSASADMMGVWGLPDLCRAEGAKLVYAIENTLETRLRIIALDRDRGLLRKARSALWTLGQERQKRAAFRRADGVQANGFPALAAYRALNRNTMIYLDNRMLPAMMATPPEMAARAAYLASAGPLRLVHSGRLETMKGAQDVVPVAVELRALGVDFTLDIYGTGSLEAEMATGITRHGLQGQVRLHGPVDFATVLVPWLRQNADLFLSCHRQADPSCTYLESIGCGLPVVGYANAMLAALVRDSKTGWTVPMGDIAALAARVATLAQDRAAVTVHAARGLTYAQSHDFRTEFVGRMDHLAATLRR